MGKASSRRTALAVLCVAIAAPATALAEAACLDAPVPTGAAEAVDTRTLKLADGRMLRLAGIEPFALLVEDSGADDKLLSRLAELVSGAALQTQLATEEPDRYGRLPALVFVGGNLVQAKLAGEGLALAFTGDDALPCFDQILAAEEKARSEGRGFWTESSVLEATPEALGARIGRFAIFEGTVVSVGTRRVATYLDFGRHWSTDVTIEIAAKDREAFGGEAELENLAGSRVRARGFLEEKAGPMLVVRSPLQIEILTPSRIDDSIPP